VAPDREATRRRVRHLVSIGEGDPLAPFALRPDKRFVFAPDGRAAVGYQIKFGTAVASGDPVGDACGFDAAIDAFVAEMRRRRLRVAVLGAGERARPRWERHGLSAVAIGRDVVIRRNDWSLRGRRMRNVRQAVQRAANAGVSVQVRREGDLCAAEVAELRGLTAHARKRDTRGFSMTLGRMFDGSQPDAVVVLARMPDGAIVGAHRYLWAGKQDLSLDLPIRHDDAPNGVDERLVAEVVDWGALRGVERVSLAFAPFPELFADRTRLSATGRAGYALAHLLDPLVKVEALYRYLRKFHAFDQQRFVMLRWRALLPTALAMLVLEFGR